MEDLENLHQQQEEFERKMRYERYTRYTNCLYGLLSFTKDQMKDLLASQKIDYLHLFRHAKCWAVVFENCSKAIELFKLLGHDFKPPSSLNESEVVKYITG